MMRVCGCLILVIILILNSFILTQHLSKSPNGDDIFKSNVGDDKLIIKSQRGDSDESTPTIKSQRGDILSTPTVKSLQGDISDFSLHRIPTPPPTTSRTMTYILKPTDQKTIQGVANGTLVHLVGSAIFSPQAWGGVLHLLTESETQLWSKHPWHYKSYQVVIPHSKADSQPTVDIQVWSFTDGIVMLEETQDSISSFSNKLKLSKSPLSNKLNLSKSQYNQIELHSKLVDSRDLIHQREMAMNAHLHHVSRDTQSGDIISTNPLPTPSISSYRLKVKSPDGLEHWFDMFDDGDHRDGHKGDAIFGATFTFTQPGEHIVSTYVEAMWNISGEVRWIRRSATHVLQVVAEQDRIVLSREGVIMKPDPHHSEMINFIFPIKPVAFLSQILGQKFYLYAEVQKDTPVAYISGVTFAQKCDSSPSGMCLQLSMSSKWFSKANVHSLNSGIRLRNVNVRDMKTLIPLDEMDNVVVTSELNSQFSILPFSGEITETMIKGPRPTQLLSLNGTKSGGSDGILIISHGYCADANPFSELDYNDFISFLDPLANRNTDDFAIRIYNFAINHPEGPWSSWSGVGHSQGGLAFTQLFSFYWTPGDNVKSSDDSRLIQSVGSPYMGTSVAGLVADAGLVFGIACGSNYDISHEGASLWLSTIPSFVRSQVYFTTTTYEPYRWCVLPLNSVLSFKNDGAAENRYAIMPGGNPVFLDLVGFCHTDMMAYPNQCKNHELNAMMNKKAAR